ncbi:MAG: signal recognition particle-docking protein FtsY, partial [Desulfatiglandales bacterium]
NNLDRIVLGKKEITPELLDELEELLYTADLGVSTTEELLKRVREKVKRKELEDPSKLKEALKELMRDILLTKHQPLRLDSEDPFVILVIGVNGVGKTTTIGKLAYYFKNEGYNPLLVAADTFRAAAIEQLEVWGQRVGVPVIRQRLGADPSAVVFDGLEAAVNRKHKVVIIDTAGRLHTKYNLMEELQKIQRVAKKRIPTAPHEVWLVLDATTGQNAISQAKTFREAVGVTGIILTKLDGTAKGGVVISVSKELGIPILWIGVGEGLEDLRPFDPKEFVEAIFD